MLEHLKEELEQGRARLAALRERVAEAAEDTADEARDFWHTAQDRLAEVEKHLARAREQLREATDESRLQAHLAAMEAAELWRRLSDTVEQAARQGYREARTDLDFARLKTHLAGMDLKDYLETDGKAQLVRLQKAGKAAETELMSVLKTLRGHMDKVAENFRREGSG